jgi:hypothetical protein
MTKPPAVGMGADRYPRRSPRQRDDLEAYGEQSWFFSEGLAANLTDGGGVMSFHIRLALKERWRNIGLSIRKGEYLEDATVKGDKVLLDKAISGFQVVIEVHLQ